MEQFNNIEGFDQDASQYSVANPLQSIENAAGNLTNYLNNNNPLGAISQAYNRIKDAAGKSYDKLTNDANNVSSDIPNNLKNNLNSTYDNLKGEVQNTYHQLSDNIKNTYHELDDRFNNAGPNAGPNAYNSPPYVINSPSNMSSKGPTNFQAPNSNSPGPLQRHPIAMAVSQPITEHNRYIVEGKKDCIPWIDLWIILIILLIIILWKFYSSKK